MLHSFDLAPQLRRLATACLIVVASCSSTGEPRASANDAAFDFRADSATYSLSSNGQWYSGTIGVTYTNRTENAASFVNCRGGSDVVLQKLIDGTWTTVWEPVTLLCFSDPLVVLPGEQRRMTINVTAGHAGPNTEPQFATDRIAGVYRAMWTQLVSDYQPGESFGLTLPEQHRVSNQFTIAAPDT